jgi:hypothetical protein
MDIFGSKDDEELDTDEVDWVTPDSSEDIEDILRAMQGINRGSDSLPVEGVVKTPVKPVNKPSEQ